MELPKTTWTVTSQATTAALRKILEHQESRRRTGPNLERRRSPHFASTCPGFQDFHCVLSLLPPQDLARDRTGWAYGVVSQSRSSESRLLWAIGRPCQFCFRGLL